MMHWYGGGWGYPMMAVTMLLFLGLVVLVVVALVRYLGGTDSPEAILARRFASGEIDEEEYRRRLAAVHGAPAP
jgi:putative membrane protein